MFVSGPATIRDNLQNLVSTILLHRSLGLAEMDLLLRMKMLLHLVTNWEIPKHALHEKGLQRQIGIGTMVSSQERRAHFVPETKNLCTAGLLFVFLRHELHEKVLHKQTCVVTLVSSQERKGLLVPFINDGRTTGRPLVKRGSTVGLFFRRF